MYDYFSSVLGIPAEPNNAIVWCSGLCLLALIIGLVYCFTRLFK